MVLEAPTRWHHLPTQDHFTVSVFVVKLYHPILACVCVCAYACVLIMCVWSSHPVVPSPVPVIGIPLPVVCRQPKLLWLAVPTTSHALRRGVCWILLPMACWGCLRDGR